MKLDGLDQRVYDAAYSMQFEGDPHPVPSPSGIHSCLRRQWCDGKRLERTDPLAVRTIKKMASGKAIEPFWRDVYRRTGFEVLQPRDEDGSSLRIPIHNDGGEVVMTGEVDAILRDLETGRRCLLELKDLGIWSYTDAVLKGIRQAEAYYYFQVQCYLRGALDEGLIDEPICVLHAGQADASAVVWIARVIKKMEQRPPDFHMELIRYSDRAFQWCAKRAETVHWLLDNVDEVARVPREFDPEALQRAKKGSGFPCGKEDNPYCGYRQLCLRAGGTTIRREEPNA